MAPTPRSAGLLAASLLIRARLAQAGPPGYGNATSSSATTPYTGSPVYPDPTGVSTEYATKSFNFSLASTYLPNTDYSDEQLAFLWDQIGPIATATITTTVDPTPEPSVYPNPKSGFHPYVPSYEPGLHDVKLPANFQWGFASAAYQIEGAAKDEGKGPSIWDLLSHRVPNHVSDNSSADITANQYYLYKQDIARIKSLGIPAYSFSVSWPRIFPFGKGPVNEAGVKHYDDVVAELLKQGIIPAITLFHWDTPLELFNEYGAWTDAQIVDDFFNYATFVIQRYGDYVDRWFTINEPQYCNFQYQYYPAGQFYPAYHGITGGNPARFTCGHYSLLAHAKVAKWYHEVYKGKGRITFKNSGNYFQANSSSTADANAAQRQYDFSLGWFNHGPWIDGDYPQSLKDTLGDILPVYTTEEKAIIKGSCDFFAIDGYTAYYAAGIPDYDACTSNSSYAGYPECAASVNVGPDGFPTGPASDAGATWLWSTPLGVRGLLNAIKKQFPLVPDLQVTEFGFAEPGEAQLTKLEQILWDLRRADYYQSYLDNILAAYHYDGINVTGVWGWAIMDNFEWASGLGTRFGLQYTNYTDYTRTPKASMFTFLNWLKLHGETGAGGAANYSQPTLPGY